MEIVPTEIPDVLIIKPQVFADERGYFFESYSKQKFMNAGIDANFVQDNESKSMKGVLRGLHFQKPPFAQGKLVRVMRGAVLDVAVDLRHGSPWYGKWAAIELTEHNKWMYWIPPGFAHGFLTLYFFINAPTFTTKNQKEVCDGTTPIWAFGGAQQIPYFRQKTRLPQCLKTWVISFKHLINITLTLKDRLHKKKAGLLTN